MRSELTAAKRPWWGTASRFGGKRLGVKESRTAELEQSKVAASQKFPLSLTGMLLFNAFENGHYAGGAQFPETAGTASSPPADGASVRQTILGLKFNGPDLPGGGKASGSLYLDFFPGGPAPGTTPANSSATLDLSWENHGYGGPGQAADLSARSNVVRPSGSVAADRHRQIFGTGSHRFGWSGDSCSAI